MDLNVTRAIFDSYHKIHVPLVVAIAICGCFSHVIIILILRRKEIFNPTNLLLMSLSASEFCLLINYLFVTFFKMASEYCVRSLWNYGWAYSLLLNVNMSIIFHTYGVVHVLAISIVRYITLSRRSYNAWFTLKKAVTSCLAIYLSVPILCIPFYLNSEVKDFNRTDACGFWIANDTELYEVGFSKLARDSGLLQFNFWLFGIVGKFVPCAILLVMSILLSLRMKSFQKASENLKRHSGVTSIRNYHRTTYLILTVMFLFVVVELPQGFLNLLSGVLSPSFIVNIYGPMGDIFEVLSILYSSINFVIFCLMNGSFREIIRSHLGFLCCCIKIEPPAPSARSRTFSTVGTSPAMSRARFPERSILRVHSDKSATVDRQVSLNNGEGTAVMQPLLDTQKKTLEAREMSTRKRSYRGTQTFCNGYTSINASDCSSQGLHTN